MVASCASAGHELTFRRPARSQEYAVILSHEDEDPGCQEIDLEAYRLRRGRALFVRPGQISRYTGSDAPDVTEIIYSRSLLDEGTADTMRRLELTPFVDIPPTQWGRVRSYQEQILTEASAPLPDWSMIRLLLSAVLYTIARLHRGGHSPRPPKHYYGRVAELQSLIAKRCSMRQRADDYARRLGVSSKRLNEITRACLGKTVSQMARDAVLTEAQRALAHSDESIKMISYRLGFDDPSYFSRFFRREAGQTPSSFRREMRPPRKLW
jgi:AraC-like DNA-binding protein